MPAARMIEYKGKTLSLRQWGIEFGVSADLIKGRIYHKLFFYYFEIEVLEYSKLRVLQFPYTSI